MPSARSSQRKVIGAGRAFPVFKRLLKCARGAGHAHDQPDPYSPLCARNHRTVFRYGTPRTQRFVLVGRTMWKRVKVKGVVPTPRNCVSGSSNDNLFIIFGGYGRSEKERFSDVYAYSPSEKKWILVDVTGDVPTPRYCTSLNMWEDKLVSFGGFDGNRLNTLHILDTHSWEWRFFVTNNEIPEPRSHHTACVVGNRLIVFGGLSQEGKRLADLHVLDLTTMTWSQPEVRGKAPLPRLGHISAVLNGNVLAVFGGYGDPDGPYQKFNELNLLHFDTMTWTQPLVTGQTPPPMYAHQAIAMGDKLVVYGGDNGTTARNLSSDLYVFDLSKMRWTKIDCVGEVPPPRSHFASAFVLGKLYVFGGSGKGEQEKLNDLYALDLASIELLREVTFDEIKQEVDHTIHFVLEEMNKMALEVAEKSPLGTKSPEYKQARRIVDEKVTAAMHMMKGQFEKLVGEKEKFVEWKQEQSERLEHERSRLSNEKTVVTQIVQSQSGRIIINVGGNRFDTSLATLTKDQNSMLAAMFSGRYPLKPEQDGSYFIDRDGAHFRFILNYLRDNTVALPPNRLLHLELLREANFYQIQGLVEHVKASLKKIEQQLEQQKPDKPKPRPRINF